MTSLKDKLITRLQGRADMNARNLKQDLSQQRYSYTEGRLEAYLTAIGDVEQIMNIEPMLTISENIKAPAKQGDVGYNLISNHEQTIPCDEVVFVKTGVKIKIPEGYWGMITARSSAVFKHHILVLQGVIDTGYTGELMIACIALTKQRILPAGTSIAQLILFPSITPSLSLVEELPTTERGETGFGSTGT